MPKKPNWKNEIAKRLSALNLAPEREAGIVDELSAHLNDEYERLLRAGATHEEALEIALDGLQGQPALAEAIRVVERPACRETIMLGEQKSGVAAGFWRDLRYAFRTLRRSPAFTALAVLSLALGIGGNAAMFNILSATLIRPLPYADPDRLVQAVHSGFYPPGGLAELQQKSRTMELAGYNPGIELNLTGVGEPVRLRGAAVSANFFHVLGAGMEMGRAFESGEDRAGKDSVAILSHALWQQRFGGDRAIVGRVISLGGVGRQVVGVASSGFAFPDSSASFWIPLHIDPRDSTAYWSSGFMPVTGRLNKGVTLAQAQQEILSLSEQMLRSFPYVMGRDWAASMTVIPLREYLTRNVQSTLVVLQCAIGLVLLIACANVAGLLLARATSRQKEIALRLAVGALRMRIAAQLLTESVTLALAGGLLGAALALGGQSALQAAFPTSRNGMPVWQVLLICCALSLVTGVIFGVAPALAASRQGLALAIKTGGQRAAGTVKARLRSALIVCEIALAVLLTVSAGLLMRSLWNLAQVNLGFQPERVLTVRVSPNQSMCEKRAACIALYDEVQRRVREIPGVQDAAAANTLPLSNTIPSSAIKVEGVAYVPAEHDAPMFWAGAVTSDYFRLMGIPILQGRAFDAGDADAAAPVVVVSAATARRYWPGQNPIGKHVQLVWEDRWRTVAGVAGDVRQFDLAGETPDYIRGEVYMPYAQTVDNDRQLPAIMTLIVRTNRDASRVAGGIREVVRDLNPNVPVSDVRSMVSIVNESSRESRSITWLFVGFAAVALALAAIGVYGVVSYLTAQRTFEIGVRMAMGARSTSVFGLVLAQSLRLVAPGLLLGLGCSLALTRLLSAFLYGTAPADPATLAAVCGILTAVALLAGCVPALRAMAIDPIIALRMD